MFVQAYEELKTQREDESWLSEQCQSDEFYHNMKKHSTLCDNVEFNRRDIMVLNALRQVVENSHLCGYESCVSILERTVHSIMKQGIMTLAVIVIVLMLLPLIILPLWRKQMNRIADSQYRKLYHAPYGVSHYRLTDHPMHHSFPEF